MSTFRVANPTRKPPTKRRRPAPVTVEQWPQPLLQEAKAAVRPGEKLVIESPTRARTVYLR